MDEDGFIQRQTVTAGNVHDSVERDTLLLGDETALYAYADTAYSSQATRDTLKRFGIADQVQRKGDRNNPLSAEDRRRNDEIAVTRAGGECPYLTTYKINHLQKPLWSGENAIYGISQKHDRLWDCSHRP